MIRLSTRARRRAGRIAGEDAEIRKRWFHDLRVLAARDLAKAKRGRDPVVGFRLVAAEDDCGVCRGLWGRLIPLKGCTVDSLPPYRECERVHGCRGRVTAVLGEVTCRPDASADRTEPGRPVRFSSAYLGLALTLAYLGMVLALAYLQAGTP